MVVSVPEKTLEHWASIYLTYRYRSNASLWWPARDEDIHVADLPPSPGKSVKLELKTTTLNAKGDVQKVRIDLDQLDNYLTLPHWWQPFYVFPMARWSGSLKDATAAGGVTVSELGFSRVDRLTAKQWWFANWMVALPASRVGDILHKELSTFRTKRKPTRADLVTTSFKNGVRSKPTWADGQTHHTIPWQKLWTRLERCGAASWPQVVRLPSWVSPHRTTIRHKDLRSFLRDSSEEGTGDIRAWGSSKNGIFGRIPDAAAGDRPSRPGSSSKSGRIEVHLGLKALRFA